ncbi:MAG: hypothetical protein JW739_08355 [Opitutales bacterium]|nr:hypothetical protein [Opitutales bacterium]
MTLPINSGHLRLFTDSKPLENRLQRLDESSDLFHDAFESVDLPEYLDSLTPPNVPELNESEARNLAYILKVELEKSDTALVDTSKKPFQEVLQQIDDVVERLKSIDVPVASAAAQHALTAGL